MPLFQIKYDLVRTEACPPNRYGFSVPKHYTTTEVERYDSEEEAAQRFLALSTARRRDEGTVLAIHLERLRNGLFGQSWKRLLTSEPVNTSRED